MKKTSKEALKVARQFLAAYKKGDYEKMYQCCTHTWKNNNDIEKLKQVLPYSPVGYKTFSAKQISSVVFDILIELQAKDGSIKALLRTICETGPYKPNIEGDYGVNPISIRKR